MSGPKDSCWSLDPDLARQRAEARSRLIRREKIKKLEEEEKSRLVTQITSEIYLINKRVSELCFEGVEWIEKGKQCLEEYETVENLNDSIEKLKKISEELTRESVNREIHAMKNYITRLKENKELKDAISEVIKACNKVDESVQSFNSTKLINGINSLRLNSDGKIDFSIEENKNLEKELKERLETFYNGLDYYMNNKLLLNKEDLYSMRTAIELLIKNTKVDDKYKIKQIETYIKDIQINKVKYNKQIQDLEKLQYEYSELYIEYSILCERLNLENKYSKNFNFLKIKEGISEIKKDVDGLRNMVAEVEDYGYIVNSINEVMEELGYDIISSEVVELTRRTVIDNIYSFEDNKAINVYTSNNGTIMFEVSGINNSKKEISSLDRLKIKESMDRFCDKYEVIKEKLKKKGVVLTKENLRPADEKYAKIRVLSIEKYKNNKKDKEFREHDNLNRLYLD